MQRLARTRARTERVQRSQVGEAVREQIGGEKRKEKREIAPISGSGCDARLPLRRRKLIAHLWRCCAA
eukprot:2226949-Pleurochrysis_carterae.AAC.1